jgi:uncharacterized protein (DUF362 family)
MSRVSKVKFTSYEKSVSRALDLIGAPERLPQTGLIIIKPNLTSSSPPPVTTPVGAAEAVYRYCALHSKARVAIGEGAGSGKTADVFRALGYSDLAEKNAIELIDFNEEKTVVLKREDTLNLKEFHMPLSALDAFIISLPVLKDHSFTVTTVSMKNMFGIAPEPYYGGSWNKSRLHSPSTHRSVFDICMYKKPSLSIIDASVALEGNHLWGTNKKLGFIIASFDPVAADAVGSRLLGHEPGKIEYLALSNGLLGNMDNIEVVS